MPAIPFSDLPDHARVWVFAADRRLTDVERDRLLAQVDGFLSGWTAHGVPLTAGREWRYDRFLVVAVDERAAGASGCSIDALTREMRTLQGEMGVDLLETAPVLFRDGDSIRRLPRREFRELAERQAVGSATIVFDNTVPTVGDFRLRWETEARHTWYAKAFPLEPA